MQIKRGEGLAKNRSHMLDYIQLTCLSIVVYEQKYQKHGLASPYENACEKSFFKIKFACIFCRFL